MEKLTKKGIVNTVITEEHAVSVMDRAESPLARWVIKLEVAPPGHTAKIISPTASSGGREKTFTIPNAFTPDGDGLNDLFRPTYLGIKKLDYFRIFNRYGVLVFETNDIGRGWDGRYKGRLQEIDNYIYILKGIDKFGSEKILKGNVLLLK